MEINLTILVPLKDRSHYTAEWIKYNIYDDFNYIFSDGSYDNSNKKIIKKIIDRNNVSYISFPPDKTYHDYYKKMYETTKLIKTDFVMTVDNDDFINPNSLKKMILYANETPSVDIFQGAQAHILKRNNKFRLIEFSNIVDFYENYSKSDIVNKLYLKHYRNLWYAVIKTENYVDVWKACKDLKFQNIQMQEIFLSLYLFLNTRFKYLPLISYIKTSNISDNNSSKYKNSTHIYDNFESDIFKIQNFFSNYKDFDGYLFKKNFINYLNAPKSQTNIIRKSLIRLYKKIFYYFLPFNIFLLYSNIIFLIIDKFSFRKNCNE